MRFLSDENIASSVVQALRKAGFDVKDVKESKLQGTSDKHLIELALGEDRIIITHDKDFYNLMSSDKIKHNGVIILRLRNQCPENVIKILIPILESNLREKIQNHITIISESKVTIHKVGGL